MDPSSPAKRRALAPLDANVNAMSPTKMHKHSKVSGSPRKSPIKTPLGLKRPLASVIFDENAVANKKQCQEPPAAAPSVSASAISNASTLVPAHVSAVTPIAATSAAASEDTIPSTSMATSAPTPTPAAPAQTETDTDPVTKEVSGIRLIERLLNGLWDRKLICMSPWQDRTEQQDQLEERHLGDEAREQRQVQEMQPREDQQTLRIRSASPDTSSVFDNSAMDMSQENTTMLTEPDAEQSARAPPPIRPMRLLTREEARQKARILRLKLGLANYKLQTGQENVPLEMLEVKPRLAQQREITRERALPRVTFQPPSSRDGPPEKDPEEITYTKQRESETEQVNDVEKTTKAVEAENTALPRLVTDETGDTEDEDEDEPTSAVYGGVASSLLSLARASSSVSSS
ncbi:hypothetical protein LY78DRAFT_598393 [Colletotrichum sublineola]|uniref:Cyclin-dependent kinase n=1 Tax=Colletotrichum sublineola TaxID=1173701 RepID=A0A066XIA7_COLSU|nr:hypothetical protein LY78DRAFT_598393 [Colletotrichum sublineola]KDN65491.1 hypothetical protein CSUB01_01053 [Colletotrichum sublineola]